MIRFYADDWWERVGQYITAAQWQAIWESAIVVDKPTSEIAERGQERAAEKE